MIEAIGNPSLKILSGESAFRGPLHRGESGREAGFHFFSFED
jgi:hypothetical protein